jgi:hypothetical protein
MRHVSSVDTSVDALRSWLPALVGVMGVVYGVTSRRATHQTSDRDIARTPSGALRVVPLLALNVGSLALVLLGSRLHGHWFVRLVRQRPSQSIVLAGQFSCQPLWLGVPQEQESDTLGDAVRALY